MVRDQSVDNSRTLVTYGQLFVWGKVIILRLCLLDNSCGTKHTFAVFLPPGSKSIPPEIGQLTSLKYLDLSNNALGGQIPQKIFNLNSLEDLYLESQKGNNWTCTRSNGEVVDVYFSQGDSENGANMGLEGKILDDNIANLSNLKNVMIHSNIFSGVRMFKLSSFCFDLSLACD